MAVVACGALLQSGCVSASLADARLTVVGRTAVPLAGQSQVQQVVDAANCRENIMDRLFYVGAYGLYSPLRWMSSQEAIHGMQVELVKCLRDLGYSIPDPPPVKREE